MRWGEACKLAQQVRQHGYQCHIRGWENSYDLLVTDHVTGYTMTIESPEDWEEREGLSKLYS